MLTYITTYYNNPELLERALDVMFECPDDRFKMIVVDDASSVSPEEMIRSLNDDRISLFRITKDIGFNSHGGRNLAMLQSTTEWNLLIDIDYKIHGINKLFQHVCEDLYEVDCPHFFAVSHPFDGRHTPFRASINDFLVTKKVFWDAGGYDPEFFGFHHGDRALLTRMMGQQHNSLIHEAALEALRSPFATTRLSDDLGDVPEKYSDDRTILYINKQHYNKIHDQIKAYEYRWNNNIKTNPVPFDWEQII